MGIVADIYEETLRTRHGLPLYRPEPRYSSPKVRIGDVGVLVDGQFRRFFNATEKDDDMLNPYYDVVHQNPSSHSENSGARKIEVLQIPEDKRSTEEKYLPPGLIHSRGIRYELIEHPDRPSCYRFTCSREKGALLLLNDYASRDSILPNNEFRDYMRKNFGRWYDHVIRNLTWSFEKEELLLVRGVVHTTQWANGVVLGTHEVFVKSPQPVPTFLSFDGSPIQQAQFRYHPSFTQLKQPTQKTDSTSDVDPTASDDNPPVYQLPQNQCIFISYYRLKFKGFLGRRFAASAEPNNLTRPPNKFDDPSVIDMDATNVHSELPRHQKHRDPVNILLDYILHHSDADVAIASDGELELLCKGGHWPEDIEAFLEDVAPPIRVDDKAGTLDLDRITDMKSMPTGTKYDTLPCITGQDDACDPETSPMPTIGLLPTMHSSYSIKSINPTITPADSSHLKPNKASIRSQ